MGHPKLKKKKYSKPTHPWQKERIEEEKELLKEFENLSSKENNPESHGFFEKIKEFWGGVNKQ